MVRKSENGCDGEGVDERAEGRFLFGGPEKGNVFL